MYSLADKTRVIRTYPLIVLVWWLFIMSPDGSHIVMEWRDRGTCEFYYRLFLRIQGLKVVNCTEKAINRTEEVG